MNNTNNTLGILTGMLIGGLAGAVTMLLLAPQSGEKTRTQIQEKGIELRDQTTGMVETAKAKIWLAQKKFVRDERRKANEILHHGQALVVEQVENITDTAKAWEKANLSVLS